MESADAARVSVLLEGMLLAPVLRPLVAGAGFVGDYELDLLAQELARHDATGFGALLAARLERAP